MSLEVIGSEGQAMLPGHEGEFGTGATLAVNVGHALALVATLSP